MRTSLAGLFQKFGDQSTSLGATGASFTSFSDPMGVQRFLELGKNRLGTSEPLAPEEFRFLIAKNFFSQARCEGKDAVILPISQKLERQLRDMGCSSIQIGLEPVIQLSQWTAQTALGLPQNRPAALLSLLHYDLEEIAPEVAKKWIFEQPQKATQDSLGFLNSEELNFDQTHVRAFTLNNSKSVLAALMLNEIPATRSVYLRTWCAKPGTRRGANELLIIRVCERLAKEGKQEVRLGLCALAHIHNGSSIAMRFVKAIGSYFYGFDGNAQFKKKLQPTYWEPKYIVKDSPFRIRDAWAVGKAILSGPLKNKIFRIVRASVCEKLRFKPLPISRNHFFARTPITSTFGALVVALQLFAFLTQSGELLHARSYFGSDTTGYLSGFENVFLSSLFHANWFHFLGNISTFLFLGYALELFIPRFIFALTLALGLFASNPVTFTLVQSAPWIFEGPKMEALRGVHDYGISNGVYALAALAAMCFRRPFFLIFPFAVNAAVLSVAHTSWLSLHHFAALLFGIFGGFIFRVRHLRDTKIE